VPVLKLALQLWLTFSILSDALLHLLVAIPWRCCCLQLSMLSLLMYMLVVLVGLP
jgi:hypothetical protein